MTYAVLTALGMLDPGVLGLPWLHVVSALAAGITMTLPYFVTDAYTFTTTSADVFVYAVWRMRMPETVMIPCMVVIRFSPTIAEDYRQIRSTVALHSITSSDRELVRHPTQSLEYILAPLLTNATNVTRDLPVVALIKGLGHEGKYTSRTLICMTVVNWLVMIVITLPLTLDIAGVIRQVETDRSRMQLPLLEPARVTRSTRPREPPPPVAFPSPMTMPQSRHCTTSC